MSTDDDSAKAPRPTGKKRLVSRVSTISPRPGRAGSAQAKAAGRATRGTGASPTGKRQLRQRGAESTRATAMSKRSVGEGVSRTKLLVILTVATIVLAAIAVLAFLKPGIKESPNTAFVDQSATSAVVTDGNAALRQFFCMDYANLDGWAQKTKGYFWGDALKNFETTYAPQTQALIRQQLGGSLQGRVDCRVDVFGVEAIDGDLAKADASVVLSSDGSAVQSGTVKVNLGLKKVDGRWKISSFIPL